MTIDHEDKIINKSDIIPLISLNNDYHELTKNNFTELKYNNIHNF